MENKSEKSKLFRLIQSIHDKQLLKKQIQFSDDIRYLREHLDEIFPSKNSVEIFYKLFKSQKQQGDSNIYCTVNLPKHINHEDWMIEYIKRLVKNKVKQTSIEYFIKSDAKYIDKRNKYEEDVSTAEIKDYVNTHDFNDSFKDLSNLQFDYPANIDILTRQEITSNLTQLDINQHSIDAALEKNTNLWLEPTMKIEFYNRFIRPLERHYFDITSNVFKDVKDKVIASYDGWKAVRTFEYGQRYGKIINEHGTATQDMKIKPSEAMLRSRAWYNNYQQIIKPVYSCTRPKDDLFMGKL